MKTPKHYTDSIKKGIITEQMLADTIYSVNKRAKNMRDNKNKYKHHYYYYNNCDKYEDKETEYYDIKDFLLSLYRPYAIHAQPITHTFKEFFYDEYIVDPIEDVHYKLVTTNDFLLFY